MTNKSKPHNSNGVYHFNATLFHLLPKAVYNINPNKISTPSVFSISTNQLGDREKTLVKKVPVRRGFQVKYSRYVSGSTFFHSMQLYRQSSVMGGEHMFRYQIMAISIPHAIKPG